MTELPRPTLSFQSTPFLIPRSKLLSGKIESIQVHYLVPRRDEVIHELFLRVLRSIDFRDRAELGVRTEDKVDPGAGPFKVARRPIAPLVNSLLFRSRLPFRTHVEQVNEEIVGQRLFSIGENTVPESAEVRAQHPQSADENGHLRRRQCQQLGPVSHLDRRP